MASVTYCTYQIILTVILYSEKKVSSNSEIFHQTSSEFPAVVFCNLNPYDGFFAKSILLDIINKKNLNESQFEPIDYVDTLIDHIKAELHREYFTMLYDMGFWLSQMLISCRFQGNPCHETDFEYFHDYNYGNCFRFNNATNIREVKSTGWRNGLRLELFAGELDQQFFSIKSGMRIVVHNQSIVPFIDEEGIDVSVGFQTNIALKRTFINRLPAPYSNCVDDYSTQENLAANDVFIFLKFFFAMGNYTQRYCLKACFQKFTIAQCGCYDFKLPVPLPNLDVQPCRTDDQIVCIQNIQSVFHSGTGAADCNQKCPIECTQILYETSISSSKYPNSWYTNLLRNYTNYGEKVNYTGYSELQQTILMVNINFDDMMYTYISQSPAMTTEELIAFIGGNFGLFIGTSLLTMMEFVELVFLLIHKAIMRMNCQKKIDKETEDSPKVELECKPEASAAEV